MYIPCTVAFDRERERERERETESYVFAIFLLCIL